MVITRFECPNKRTVLEILWLHFLLRRRCRRALRSLIDVKAHASWRQRLVLSVSLWSEPTGVLGMGAINEHVRLSRFPSKRGIATSCGVFTFSDDWRNLMFGANAVARSPLSEEAP